MSRPPDPDEDARLRRCISEITEMLGELETPWTIAGAFAARDYRLTDRYTSDADLLVSWDERIPGRLEELGFAISLAVDDGEVHLIRARRSDAAVDLIVAGTAYQELAIERGLHSVLSMEDVLVHKVIAWRDRDRDDIASILATRQPFDRAYVEHWVRVWDYEDRWREAQSWGD